MSKPRIYIAGKMRHCEHFNFEAFDHAREKLAARGWDVVSPADLDIRWRLSPNLTFVIDLPRQTSTSFTTHDPVGRGPV